MLQRKKGSVPQKGSNKKISIRVQLPQSVCIKVVKIETNIDLCRVCLKQGTIPIHRDNPSEDLTHAVTTFGGIAINISDSYPKYLCQSCFSLLKGAILFKKTAQQSDKRLRKSTEPKPIVAQNSDERHKRFTVPKTEDEYAEAQDSLERHKKFTVPKTEPQSAEAQDSDEHHEKFTVPKTEPQSAEAQDSDEHHEKFTVPKTEPKSAEAQDSHERHKKFTVPRAKPKSAVAQDSHKRHKKFTAPKPTVSQDPSERHKKFTVPKPTVAQDSDERLKKSTVSEPVEDDDLSDSAHDTDTDSFIPTKKQKTVTRLVSCKLCDLEFKTFQEYKAHTLTDEHLCEKKTCSICNKTYTRDYFRTHMKIHRKKTAYICDVCGRHFVLLQTFLGHQATHSDSLPYKCSLCPYKGRLSDSLKTHMRSHTGEKPYECKECPKRFVTKSNLSRHILTHKTRDFKCECGRGYYTKRDFDWHLKVEHTGMKEHVCPTCGKAFGYRKHMMRHQLKVHKRDKLRPGKQPIYLKVESMKQQQQEKEENN